MIKNYSRLLLAALFLFYLQLSAQGSAASDRDALIAIYNATDGDNWTNSWDLSAPTSTWGGVTIDASNRVVELRFNFFVQGSLTGSIPKDLGDLTELKILLIVNNSSITGSIPSSIGNLSKLEQLEISSSFSGTIPASLFNLANLKVVRITTGNQLTGSAILNSFTSLTNLTDLDISYNNFTGTIPSSIQNLTNLKTLRLNNNNLTGTLPDALGNMPNLETLDLRFNEFTGVIPSALGNLSNLKLLNLGNLNLETTIPTSFGNLTNLESLFLERTGLIGNIPVELGNLTNLNSLILSINDLTGPIPEQLGNLTNLTYLFLSSNDLTGTIPPSFSNLVNLKTLAINTNDLEGTIPIDFSNLTLLENLRLYSNNLTGNIPTGLANLNNLKSLEFATNDLSGNVPLIDSPNLTSFNISGNQFIFEDIEDNISMFYNISRYNNQSRIDDITTIDLIKGESTTLEVEETASSHNSYQWRKDGAEITGATQRTLFIEDVSLSDAGSYTCIVNNSIATELTLVRYPITIIVTSTDDDEDGVPNDIDQCSNTPMGVEVDSQGCIITDPTQTNFLQNFSFENWSGNPLTPNNWTITNANSIIRNTEATDGNYSLEIDLNNSLQFKTELQNTATIQLATNTTYTYSFDYKIKRGDNVSAEIQISKDGNPFGIRIADEFVGFVSDGAWHTFSFEFDTNDIDEDHIFKLVIRANTAITGIIQIDNMRVLGEALADADNDGVLDDNDLCPNTPSTVLAIDENGCEINIDTSNLLEDPSFEDWSLNGGTNLRSWGINLIPGSSWNKNEDISDNLLYSLELTTGDNGSNASSIFQNDIELFNGVEYLISIDYKVLEGTYSSLELELTTGFFETFEIFTIDPTDAGWQTLTRTFTADSNAMANLRVAVVSNQAQRRILLDNMVLKVNVATTDTDNDGVEDTNDNCPNTPSGDTVDANGCTVTTITDSDNDGVVDADDDCPNTPAGETVNVKGCALDQNPLPEILNNGIQVKVTNTSCPDAANGEISVSFDEDYNYTLQITGLLLDNTFSNISSTDGLVRSDLSSGTYTVCVTIPEFPNYEQCFNATIETPEEFNSGKTVIDYTAQKASIVVSGSKNYEVFVNDKIYSFQFDNTTNQQLSFPLDKGSNLISIETDKICQGVFNDSVIVNNAILSPNPVADVLKVEGLESMGDAQIVISNLNGTTALLESKQITSGILEMNISSLSPGIYVLTITNGEKDINIKFVKK